MGLLLMEPPAAYRLDDSPGCSPALERTFDPLAGLDLLAGLDEISRQAVPDEPEPDVDLSPELAGNALADDRPDVSDLAAAWGRALAEFPFTNTPAAVAPFARPMIFPTRGWHFAATKALEMLPADIHKAIATAAAVGSNAVVVTTTGETHERNHDFWPEKLPEPDQWPDDPPAASEASQGEPSDEAGRDEEIETTNADGRFMTWIPSKAEIAAGAAEVRSTWTPADFRKAKGKRTRQRSRQAVFGSMTDRSLYGDD